MKLRVLSVVSLLACSSFVHADWTGSVNYSNFFGEPPFPDFNLGTVGITLGYKFDISERFRLLPELRVGFGVNDDSVSTFFVNSESAEFKLDNYVGFALRGEYIATDNLYLFAVLSNQNFDVELESVVIDGQTISDVSGTGISETEFGYGAGLGWKLNDHNALELSYEDVNGTDLITLGYRIKF